MAGLGISIYPEHSTKEENLAYIRLAGKYGFKRVFTCLLSVGDKSKEALAEEFRDLNDAAHAEGMEVVMDVNPGVFSRLGITYDNLGFFHDIHADGIRLDEGFDGMKESLMTYNSTQNDEWSRNESKKNLKIELNASGGNGYIESVMSNFPNIENLITCHNFFPQKYTGLSLKVFEEYSRLIKEYHLHTAAFVSSNNGRTFGPWPVNEGLCTLEMHRGLPIDLQVRHLFATGLIDDVLIANAFASEEELKACARIEPGLLTLGVELEKELTPVEKEILYFSRKHAERADASDYLVRSSAPRSVYGGASVAPANTRDVKRGDVMIVNDNYSRYKGELQIALKPMENDGRKNVIGHIPEQELFLLDYIEPRKIFGFQEPV